MSSSKKRASPTPVKSSAVPKRPAEASMKSTTGTQKASAATRGNGSSKPTNGAAKATVAAERPGETRRTAGASAATSGSKTTSGSKSSAPASPAPPKASTVGKGSAAASSVGGPKPPAGKRPTKSPVAEPPPPPAVPLPPRKLPKGGPSKADLRRYRDALLARRHELLSSSSELAAGALQASGGEFSVDHMADHGSDNYEQDFNLKLLEGEADQLAEIRDALLKLDGKLDPPFGVCESCADADRKLCDTCPWIPASRLDAIPHARLCVQMKEREESVE
jgi:RNA polymerase-binding transcription factor DksA